MILGVPPSDPGAKPRPLVVALHGCTQTAAGYARGAGWADLAIARDFILLLPEQRASNNRQTCFSWFEPGDTRRGDGEVESIRGMIAAAIAEHGADPRRVYVTGLSAGGAMTGAMLAAYPELFAGGAIIAGLPYGSASGVGEAFEAMYTGRIKEARAWGDLVRAASPPGPPVGMALRLRLAWHRGYGRQADQRRRTRQAMDQCPRPRRVRPRRRPYRHHGATRLAERGEAAGCHRIFDSGPRARGASRR